MMELPSNYQQEGFTFLPHPNPRLSELRYKGELIPGIYRAQLNQDEETGRTWLVINLYDVTHQYITLGNKVDVQVPFSGIWETIPAYFYCSLTKGRRG